MPVDTGEDLSSWESEADWALQQRLQLSLVHDAVHVQSKIRLVDNNLQVSEAVKRFAIETSGLRALPSSGSSSRLKLDVTRLTNLVLIDTAEEFISWNSETDWTIEQRLEKDPVHSILIMTNLKHKIVIG